MDGIEVYICALYVYVAVSCVIGAFSRVFCANLLQRLALACLGMWSVWRIQLVIESGWGIPHEPLIATSLGLYALGTMIKTFSWRWKKNADRI